MGGDAATMLSARHTMDGITLKGCTVYYNIVCCSAEYGEHYTKVTECMYTGINAVSPTCDPFLSAGIH
jgi:hypothetical protein